MIIRKAKIPQHIFGDIQGDIQKIMDMFNKELSKDKLFIPRKAFITDEEVRGLWLPYLDENIIYVAELVNEQPNIIGAALLIYNIGSFRKRIGKLNLLVNSEYDYKKIAMPLLQESIRELKNRRSTGRMYTAYEHQEEVKMMRTLGYKEKEEEDDLFKKAGLSGKIFVYDLP
jgi:hypothetical protein